MFKPIKKSEWQLKVSEIDERLVEKVGRKLVENSLRIILLMEKDSKISKKKISEILGISETAVDKHIKKLKDLGVIERVGPDKGGYWEVLYDGSKRNL